MPAFRFPVAPPSPQVNVTVKEDDIQQNPQLYFQGSDIVWVLISSGLVLLMVPAMCLFYGGASDRPASLKVFRLPLITAAFVGVQWYLWGYTLTFTPAIPTFPTSSSFNHPTNISWYGGDTEGNTLHGTLTAPVGAAGFKIPELLYEFYEGMFASFTAALVSGAAIKKGVTVGRFIVFISLWSLLVYNPVARWSWHWSGWSSRYGTMDFAGGTAVHITSGTTVLAFNIFYALDTKTKKDWSNTRQKVRENLDKLWAYLSFRDLRDNDPVSQMTRRRDRQRLEDYVYARRSVPDRDTGHPNLSMNGEPIENNSTHRGRDGNTIVPHDEEHTENASDSHQNLAVVEALGRGADVEPGGAYDPRKWTDEPPHNCDYMVLGTALLWIGWLGFNGGSALGANMRAVSACVSTHVAACSGGCTSLLIFWLLKQFSGDSSKENAHHVLSVTHFCDGVVIGLVAITPAAGFVPPWSSAIFGIVGAIVVSFLKMITRLFLSDAPLYIFAIHAGGGMVGMFLTGCFADQKIVGLDGYSSIPDRTVAQMLRYQMLDAFMGFFYTLFMTLAILYALKVVRFVCRREWKMGFERAVMPGKFVLEPTIQHEWREIPKSQEGRAVASGTLVEAVGDAEARQR